MWLNNYHILTLSVDLHKFIINIHLLRVTHLQDIGEIAGKLEHRQIDYATEPQSANFFIICLRRIASTAIS